jgi:putative drug exporter of the RND superfamily
VTGENPSTIGGGERLFRGLGRGIVRHPWYPVVFWIILLVITLPFLGRLASVTTSSATNLPSTAPSAIANSELARLFPNSSSGGSESIIVLTGPNITGPDGQAITGSIVEAIGANGSLTHLAGVDSLYTAYGAYLGGVAQIAWGALEPALAGGLGTATNQTATVVWGTVAAYLSEWQSLVASNPGTPSNAEDAPAYNATATSLSGNAAAEAVLAQFYGSPATPGFNASACGNDPSTVVACSQTVARAALSSSPSVTQVPTGPQVLAELGPSNYSSLLLQQTIVATYVADGVGLPAALLLALDEADLSPTASTPALDAWADQIAQNETVAEWPMPVPLGVYEQYVSSNGAASLVLVEYDVSDSYTTSTGANPDFEDVDTINSLLPRAVTDAPGVGSASSSYTATQTGPAPLDATENAVLSSTLAIVLPLTILTLIGITIVYFRSPLAPAVSFAGLGIALVLGLGGVVLIGTLIGPVDSTSLTLATTFVLGVGTDYSIFLIARYREELWRGAAPEEALVTSVTWAGQSIATSGAAAVIATLALAFSGVALLSQWGEVLSFAVLMAVLLSLTMVPAVLRLLGPRVFWPSTGARFRRAGVATMAKRAAGQTYFYRTARRVRARPATVIVLILAVSVPLAYIAVTSPVAYDFYGQIPSGYPATDGLATLNHQFGPGFAFPMVLLVTFQSPLLPAGGPNSTEFSDLNSLTNLVQTTAGVASVASPTSPVGAPLSTWQNFTTLPAGDQQLLKGTLGSFVGNDGRTVLISVVPSSGGLSAAAVTLLGTLKSTVGAFEGSHPSITGVAYGGGASETNDIRNQVGVATERLAIAVSIGLILVLLVVLRSAIIPPMAVATIGLSIGWAWGVTNLLLGDGLGLPLFYFAPTVLFILILGLGIDYNIFLLTRVREERLRGRTAEDATIQAVASTGGIITAAAIILASAFLILTTGQFILLQAIGFSVAAAVLLDAMVVRTYLVPAALFLLGERVWWWPGRKRPAPTVSTAPAASDTTAP